MTLAVLASGLIAAAHAREAKACSAPACVDGHLVPTGTVPANLAALVWTPIQSFLGDPGLISTASVALVASNGEHVPVRLDGQLAESSLSWRLVPERPLREGESYVLQHRGFCPMPPTLVVTDLGPIAVGPAAPLATTLGALEVTRSLIGMVPVVQGASCTMDLQAELAVLELRLSPEAEPWKDAFLFETYVDGEAWRPKTRINAHVPVGESWQGRGRDMLFAVCDPTRLYAPPNLEAGLHKVRMRAALPGTAIVLETPELEVALTGCPSGQVDAGPVAVSEDANAAGDAGAPAPNPRSPAPASNSSCACVQTQASATGWLLGLLLAGALLWRKKDAGRLIPPCR